MHPHAYGWKDWSKARCRFCKATFKKDCHNTFVKSDDPAGVSYYAVELCPVHSLADRLAAYLRQFHEWHARDWGEGSIIWQETQTLLQEYDTAKERHE
jgi:hypothetical protein